MSWLSPENITPSSPNADAEYLFYMGGLGSVKDAQKHIDEQAEEYRKAGEMMLLMEWGNFSLEEARAFLEEKDEEHTQRLLEECGFRSVEDVEEFFSLVDSAQEQG